MVPPGASPGFDSIVLMSTFKRGGLLVDADDSVSMTHVGVMDRSWVGQAHRPVEGAAVG